MTTESPATESSSACWTLPMDCIGQQYDGVAMHVVLRPRCRGWTPTRPPPPDFAQLLPIVAHELAGDPDYQRFTRIREDVAGASRAIAEALRDQQASALDATNARLDLRGAALAQRLAEIGRERAASEAQVAELQSGLAVLRQDLAAARGRCEHALVIAALTARATAGERLRSREEILDDICAAVGPLLSEFASWTPTQDPRELVQRARAEFLLDAAPAEEAVEA